MVKKHTLTLDARSRLEISAVDDVVSFDESMISLSVGESTLNISGNELSIKNLSLENGEIVIEGSVGAMVYFDEPMRRRKRLFSKS